VPLRFPDEDFPDDLHLSLDAAARFSRALAEECARIGRDGR